MENLTLEQLKRLVFWYDNLYQPTKQDTHIQNLIQQAIADKEFEEKTRPLNF